jgi:acyl-CoA thioesterase-2
MYDVRCWTLRQAQGKLSDVGCEGKYVEVHHKSDIGHRTSDIQHRTTCPELVEGLNIISMLNLIQLEQLEDNLFRGQSKDIGSKSVFGGQVLAQSLSAAAQTVQEKERLPHSMHGYFILPGDISRPIIYQVETTRDGGSFSTRRVTAIQHGKAIFHMAASFQADEEGYEHEAQMPDVPMPEELDETYQQYRGFFEKLPPKYREIFLNERPIDFRPVELIDPFNPEKHPPIRNVWIRATPKIPDDALLNRCVLAYASDFNLLTTAMLPHQLSFLQRNLQLASLDHAMWFHRHFNANEWLLYHIDSPSASAARGFCRGSIYDTSGRLVASVAQEGLMRLRKSER